MLIAARIVKLQIYYKAYWVYERGTLGRSMTSLIWVGEDCWPDVGGGGGATVVVGVSEERLISSVLAWLNCSCYVIIGSK